MLLTLKTKGITAKIDTLKGGAIIHMSDGVNGNVLDNDDDGRCVQASYYFGQKDGYGGLWMGMQDFPCNAVQGGDWTGKAEPKTLVVARTTTSIATETEMVDWVTGKPMPVILRQVVSVTPHVLTVDRTVIVDDSFTTPGTPQHQELPAVFAIRPYSLLLTGGHQKIALLPRNGTNQYGTIVHGWVGLTNSKMYGIFLTTDCTEYTAYRVDGLPKASCAYVAPIATHTIFPGWTFSTRNKFYVGTLTTATKHLNLKP